MIRLPRPLTSKLIAPLLTSLVLASLACTPASPRPTAEHGDASGGPREPARTLVIAIGRPPDSLAAKPLREVRGSGTPTTALRAFNAGLVIWDERNQPRPYLAEALPQLGTESWRLLDDGRMETTYRLRPNLTWHDGTPLVGEDFAFALRVYATPEYGIAASPPVNLIEEVAAPDPRTVVFRWSQSYAGAADLQAADFAPLPRHILEGPFAQREPDAFIAHPFWLTEYVGLGPYRLRRVELGTYVEGEAFAGHVLGRAKIASIRLLPLPDSNTVLANLLSDAVQAATDTTLDITQAVVLEREWAARGREAGAVIKSPVGVRFANFQMRPEFVQPRALQDIRVRKAVAHATDRQALVDGATDGLTSPADTIVLREVEYYPALDRVLTKYPHDLRRARQLMDEAGYAPGPDGFYASPVDGRFTLEAMTVQGARNDIELTVLTDVLRRDGIDAQLRLLTRAQRTNDPLLVGNFPGIFIGHNTGAVDPPLRFVRTDEIVRAETRGRGSNWSGVSLPEVDRLVHAYETTLDRGQRNQYLVDILKILSEEVPYYALYYSLSILAHTGNLRGPVASVSNDVATWNLHEWEWTS